MKGKSITLCIAVLTAIIAPQAAWATYMSIQHNLVDGITDTQYNASTGLLTWDSNARTLTLNDPNPLGGGVSNVSVHLETHFTGYNPVSGNANFAGGNFMLKFDYGSSTGQHYSIGGPIDGMRFKLAAAGPSLSTIDGEGLFTAARLLPGSNDWPAQARSSIDSLTLVFGANLTGYDWSYSLGYNGVVQTIYSLLPNESAAPDPASLTLVLAGSAFVLRRRRR